MRAEGSPRWLKQRGEPGTLLVLIGDAINKLI
ncbi:hypothetical protein AciX9_3898 (plasmid) [Granulicella tundricola MP5ACTX9]|uniref:Uncharacterized protein n=1 Tax=Granulicella tundricola (strain ATCC BAA-1859 / DSM 23138 / MP5ACTX9) TaxID=1198114 RepID=E8X6M6_GRATM|nr:hypothetical protein AciX9_3898 [Granulicella tundricola MP5ACTX9]